MEANGLLITGARVYTADPGSPWGEAVLTEGSRVAYVGSEREAHLRAGHDTEELHVPGGLAVPGLNDSHIHLSYGARTLKLLSLEGVGTVSELQERLRVYVVQHPEREWVEAYGLAYEPFSGAGRPERQVIDEAISHRPVFVRAFDYHSAWCNTLALRRAGIERGGQVSSPGEVVVDSASGLATGMLKENPAIELVTSLIPEPGTGEKDQALAEVIRYINRLGITSVQNMDGDQARLEQYARLHTRGELTVRASHYLRFPRRRLLDSLEGLANLAQDYPGSWNRVAGLKLFMDGVIEAKTAWMAAPYADGSEDVGSPAIDPDLYREAVRQADALGISVATHAIGDLAVHAALTAYGAARGARPAGGPRHRIEHVEVALPADITRFRPLGVIASMQPYHAAPTTDPRYTSWNVLVGPEREPCAFPWRALLEAGALLAFGSDWPIVTPDVRVGIRTAVSRTNSQGQPPGGWQPQQAVTVAQALDAYTRSAAIAEGQEKVKGVLRPGMAADVTVFAEDLFRLAADELPGADVVATVVGGRLVHREA